MSNGFDTSELASLAAALPGRIHAATQEVVLAERHLAHALLMRETGQPLRPSEIGVARMALARTQRVLEDLKRLQDIVPGLLVQARDSRRAGRTTEVVA